MIEIIPAILPESLEHLSSTLRRLKGAAGWVQIDITDGKFVDSVSWPMHPGEEREFAHIAHEDEGLPHWQDFNFEVDLMVQRPERVLPDWVRSGVGRAVIHLESEHDLTACIDAAGDAVELGLAINLDPPYERIASYLPRVAYIQVMGIRHLGRQGERADEQVYAIIKKLTADFPDVTIQVDGGVNAETAPRLIEAGAARLASGSFILHADDPRTAIRQLSGQ